MILLYRKYIILQISYQTVKQNYISSDNSASDIKSEKDVGLKNLLHSLDC